MIISTDSNITKFLQRELIPFFAAQRNENNLNRVEIKNCNLHKFSRKDVNLQDKGDGREKLNGEFIIIFDLIYTYWLEKINIDKVKSYSWKFLRFSNQIYKLNQWVYFETFFVSVLGNISEEISSAINSFQA